MNSVNLEKPVQKQDPFALNKSDVFLCASNVVSVASTALLNMGIDDRRSILASRIVSLAVFMGEILAGGNPKSRQEAFITLALIYSRGAILEQSKIHPVLNPFVFVTYAIGTFGIFKKAVEEIKKSFDQMDSKGENNWKIARNVFVHSVNMTAAGYRTLNLFGSTIATLRGFFAPSFYSYERTYNSHFSSSSPRSNSSSESKLIGIAAQIQESKNAKDGMGLVNLINKLSETVSDFTDPFTGVRKPNYLSLMPVLCPDPQEKVDKCYKALARLIHPDKHTTNADHKEASQRAFSTMASALGY
jgi:hypothetical protein